MLLWWILTACGRISAGDSGQLRGLTELDSGSGGSELPACSERPELQRLLVAARLDLASAEGLGVSLGWIDQGRLVCAEGIGYRDPERSLPMGAQTLHRIGSLTKSMTALGVLQLAEAGELELDEELALWGGEESALGLPQAPTPRQLLTHTAGLRDHLPLEDRRSREQFFSRDLWEEIGALSPPGRIWNYSNSNYSLLGWLIEERSGRSYEAWVREQLWEPLGMQRTHFEAEEVLKDGDYAWAMAPDWEGEGPPRRVEPDSYDSPWARSAAFAWSSVEDLGRLAEFLLSGDSSLLSDALREEMLRGQEDSGRRPGLQSYGYGIWNHQGYFLGSDWYKEELLLHHGSMPGFSSSLILDPARGRGLIWLANSEDSHPRLTSTEALTLGGGLSSSSAPSQPVERARLLELLGRYQGPPDLGELQISWDGERLTAALPQLDARGERYEEELTFLGVDRLSLVLDGQAHELVFHRDEEGGIRWVSARSFLLRPLSARASGSERVRPQASSSTMIHTSSSVSQY